MAGTVTVAGYAGGLASGAKQIGPYTILGAGGGSILDVNLTSGDNTITIPPNVSTVIIVPPTGNSTALKVRSGSDSGAGVGIDPATPFGPWKWSGTPTTLIINAGGSVAGVELSFI